MPPSLKQKLSDFLIEKKVLTPETLEQALQKQKEKGGRLSPILIEMGVVSEKDLVALLSENLGIPPVDLSRFEIDPAMAKVISREIAYHYEIVPISKIGDTVTIAIADPLNLFAAEEIKALTGLEIRPTIATEVDIRGALRKLYDQSMQQAIEDVVKRIKQTTKDKVELVEAEEGEAIGSEELLRLTQGAPVVQVTNLVLEEACRLRASDILIEPMQDTVRIRYRVDGILKTGTAPPRTMHEAVVSRIKVMSNMDIAERRLPQDGRFKMKLQEREIDFRVSTVPSSFGEKVALRVLDKSQAPLNLDGLGFEEKPLEDMKKASLRPYGMILVCGPTGSGKTTTLYSILKYVDSPEKNIVTVEDPVEFQLEGINQVTARTDIGLTYAAALRSILRQDPDIIMVGEIRDFETVDVGIKAALTGHLVLSTLHTTTACGAVVRLLNMGVEPFLITSAVTLACSQRLLRKLCSACRKPYRLDAALAGRLGLPFDPKEEVKFYRGAGCSQCFGTGYSGRMGVMETLPLTPRIRELVLNRARESELLAEAKKEGLVTLREDALSKAREGKTSLEEVFRVT
ncbi:MAG: Flp pilus assembly complex ATPase component TadA [Candidatus Omnitrophica bacterium]|nr:Flp pilus assembly complex ATPase component TadA [Candidatus Omnitrophota bacterium]